MNLSIFGGALLHSEGDHGLHEWLLDLLSGLGRFGEFIDEVLIHGIIDTLSLVPFLFLTYLLMEFIEHRASDKVTRIIGKAGALGPLAGGMIGAVPQCGFSAVAANLYTGRVISLGTVVAVFLSTSDEMLPIMLAENIKIGTVLSIVLYKIVVGVLAGLTIDLTLKLMKKPREEINIDEICDNDNCHCEGGILGSAFHHTIHVSLFIFTVTLLVNTLIFFIGEENLGGTIVGIPIVGHVICAIVGLIPNCAASVALTRLATSGIISSGAMMSGLFSGAGVGLLILFRVNRRMKENVIITLLLVGIGIVFGIVADFIPWFAL